jgi:hypothetical protein
MTLRKSWLRSWWLVAISFTLGILLAVAIILMGGSQYNAVFAFAAVLLLVMLVKRK